MVKPRSQTDITERSSSEEMGALDRVKNILSPFKSDRWLSIAVLAVVAVSAPAVWNWVELQKNPTDGAKRKFDASLEGVKTVAAIVGGVVVYLNYKVSRDKAEDDKKLAESRLKMERFNKAVEMLGKNDSIHLRLGGIYALEGIAADSDKNTPDETYRLILEVLTAFVRENAPYPPKKQEKQEDQPQTTEQPAETGEETTAALPPLPTDIQAVLTVLERRKHKSKDWEQYPLDLRKTDLRRADLRYVDLTRADLRKANLQEANLWGAELQMINLQEAILQEANLYRAGLEGASLREAMLEEANLWDAKLQDADLWGAELQGADLRGAAFWNPILTGFNLAEAKEKARANLQSAKNWETAQYDPEIREWLGLPPENSSVE